MKKLFVNTCKLIIWGYTYTIYFLLTNVFKKDVANDIVVIACADSIYVIRFCTFLLGKTTSTIVYCSMSILFLFVFYLSVYWRKTCWKNSRTSRWAISRFTCTKKRSNTCGRKTSWPSSRKRGRSSTSKFSTWYPSIYTYRTNN